MNIRSIFCKTLFSFVLLCTASTSMYSAPISLQMFTKKMSNGTVKKIGLIGLIHQGDVGENEDNPKYFEIIKSLMEELVSEQKEQDRVDILLEHLDKRTYREVCKEARRKEIVHKLLEDSLLNYALDSSNNFEKLRLSIKIVDKRKRQMDVLLTFVKYSKQGFVVELEDFDIGSLHWYKNEIESLKQTIIESLNSFVFWKANRRVQLFNDYIDFLNKFYGWYNSYRGDKFASIEEVLDGNQLNELNLFTNTTFADLGFLCALLESQKEKNITLLFCGAAHAVKLGTILGDFGYEKNIEKKLCGPNGFITENEVYANFEFGYRSCFNVISFDLYRKFLEDLFVSESP